MQELHMFMCNLYLQGAPVSRNKQAWQIERHVQHWQCAGYCDEQDWIELSTVKGYRRIVMCQEVRDELDINLALPEGGQQEEEEWQRVLIAMCDGRLLPTPWLNKVTSFASLVQLNWLGAWYWVAAKCSSIPVSTACRYASPAFCRMIAREVTWADSGLKQPASSSV